MHIGSQITDLQPFRDAFALMRELACDAARATATTSAHLDIGGGLGVPYLERQRDAALAAGIRARRARDAAAISASRSASSPAA